MAEAKPPPPPLTLLRRNSISTSAAIPAKLTVPSRPLHTCSLPPLLANGNSSVSSTLDFELASFKSSSSYTSLKDILPSSSVNSPTGAVSARGSACEISIRNRLVKQAAWAYLQPMSSSPDSSRQHFFRRLWLRFSWHNPITACIRFINVHVIQSITEVFDRILSAIRVYIDK